MRENLHSAAVLCGQGAGGLEESLLMLTDSSKSATPSHYRIFSGIRRDSYVTKGSPLHLTATQINVIEIGLNDSRIHRIFLLRGPRIVSIFDRLVSHPNHISTIMSNTAPIKWAQRSDSLYLTIALPGTDGRRQMAFGFSQCCCRRER